MEEKFNHIFSENLKRLRKLERLTQRDISEILKTDRSAIANYERGARVPPLDVLVTIAEHFNISLDYLILGKRASDGAGQTTNQEVVNELMAENMTLMENHTSISRENETLNKEVEILSNVISSLKTYNQLLDRKIKAKK
jgi:transcriptional regulator with XRE-family HTH domain